MISIFNGLIAENYEQKTQRRIKDRIAPHF